MRLAMFIFATLLSHTAFSDEFHQEVVGACDAEKIIFTVDYVFGYNEEGEALIKERKKNSIDKCTLGNNVFTFNADFRLGSPDGRGRCGGHTYVTVKILKNSNKIFEKLILDDCHYSIDYISKIEVNESGELNVIRKPY